MLILRFFPSFSLFFNPTPSEDLLQFQAYRQLGSLLLVKSYLLSIPYPIADIEAISLCESNGESQLASTVAN